MIAGIHMMTQFTLTDGVQIEMSTRKGNRSGYTGAAFSPAWTLDGAKPFVAACGNPRDPLIMSQLRAQHRTSWHGGTYADAREAAYVVARFRADPVGTEHELESQGGSWKSFPSDLYDLPVVCSSEQADMLIKAAKLVKTQPARTVKVTTQLNILDVMREVGVALKGVPKDHKFVRETLEAQMPWFRNMQDAIGLAFELVRTHNRS